METIESTSLPFQSYPTDIGRMILLAIWNFTTVLAGLCTAGILTTNTFGPCTGKTFDNVFENRVA